MAQNVNYRAVARRAARRYGLDPHIFVRQINAESSFNPNASSGVAFGIAQFTPDTARSVGVNPYHPRQALDAAAKLMAGYVHKYGSYRNALVAYNAGPGRVGGPLPGETQRYIAKILGGSNPTQLNRPQSGGAVGRPGRNGSFNVTTTTGGGGAQGLDVPGIDTSALAALLSQQQQPQQPVTSYIAPPAQNSYLPGAGLQLPQTPQPVQQDNGLAAKLAALSSLSPDASLSASPQRTTTTTVRGAMATAPAGRTPSGARINGHGHVTYVGPAAQGVNHPVKSFLSALAAYTPISATTGKIGHTEYVKGRPGVISDHWRGNAEDLGSVANGFPIGGGRGNVIAARAIQLATGASYQRAMQIAKAGGIHNYYPKNGPWAGRRIQIIWRAPDHYDHVHIGVQ